MSSPINVGFIGLSSRGWAAHALAPSLLQSSLKDKYNLVAVSTTTEKSAAASAEKYSALTGNKINAYYGPSARITSDKDVDFVAVSVKAPLHKETILPVIEAGKDFFLEWPAGRNIDEAREIASAARRKGVKSLIGLQGRHSATTQKVKELLSSGVIGTVHSITTITTLDTREYKALTPIVSEQLEYTTNESNGVTALAINVGHELDTFTQLFGEFASITASAAQVYPKATIVDENGVPVGAPKPLTAPDHYTITGSLASGAVASMVWRIGYKSTPGRRNYLWEIDGEEGSIRLEIEPGKFPGLSQANATVYLNGEKVEVEGYDTHLIGTLGEAWKTYADGKDGHYATIEDAVRNHERLEVIRQSIREGRTVKLV